MKIINSIWLLLHFILSFAKTQYLNIANEFELIQPSNIKTIKSDYIYEIINVNPTIITNNELVTISYYSSNPQSNDWIGAYSPEINPENLSQTTPIKYAWANTDIKYIKTGFGNLKFNFTNLRESVGFYYFTNGLSQPLNVQSTYNNLHQTVKFKNPNQPLYPRIVADSSGLTTNLQLVWNSKHSTSPVLFWGLISINENIVMAQTDSIEKSELCGYPATTIGWRDIGQIHLALFANIFKYSGEKIYYKFGDLDTNNFSEEYNFIVPAYPGKQTKTTAIAFDDLGRGSLDDSYTWNEYGKPAIYTAMSVANRINQGDIDVVFHGGDISYARGYMAVWNFYLDMISPITSKTLYLTSVGNHETDWPNTSSYYNGTDSGGECSIPTMKLYPQAYPSTIKKPWWSYDVGLIHWIGLSSEHDYSIGSEQYLWLESDLASVDRKRIPWIIFCAHRAMYINSYYSGSITADIEVMDWMIKNLEPVLLKYKVNIGLYGHNHVYQRHSAIRNKTVVQHPIQQINLDGISTWIYNKPEAPVHLVIGTGGASFTYTAVEPKPEWNEVYMYKWGYILMTAHNESHMEFKFIQNSDDTVLDHFILIQ